jgi:hypothetical protein
LKRSVRLTAWSALLVTAVGTIALGYDYWRDRRVREALFRALDPVLITNCELRRYGKTNDGGYLMCANLMPPAQSAYSYGVNGEDSWGCAVSTAAKVPVHQYDCFDVRRPHCPTGATAFHIECVEGERKVLDGRPYDTMANQIEANGDTGKRLVVKMDVEGSEWTALLAAPDHVLAAIDQMAVEFHEVEDPAYLDTIKRLDQFFYVAHVHQNNFECSPGYDPFPGKVFEVLFVNKRIAVADPWKRGRRPSPLEMPNNPATADCQIAPGDSEPARIWGWLRRQARELRSAFNEALSS